MCIRAFDAYINISNYKIIMTKDKIYKESLNKNSIVDQMILYILDAIDQLDVFIEKRNDGGYIVVAD